jgi:hypothetical protein
LPQPGQPTDGKGPEAPTRRPKKKGTKKPLNEEQKRARETKGWFNDLVVRVNAVINELHKVMEHCEPEQHKLLATLEPTLLLEAFQKGEKQAAKFVDWIETPLEKAANKLVREGRVKITPAPKPARRASARNPVQPVA